VTFVEPTKYPDRLAPLFYAVSMADRALVVVEAINAQLGECIVMLQCAGVKQGYIVLRNYLTADQLAPLIRGRCWRPTSSWRTTRPPCGRCSWWRRKAYRT
jgi:selenocysteine-specific translation elongation factor